MVSVSKGRKVIVVPYCVLDCSIDCASWLMRARTCCIGPGLGGSRWIPPVVSFFVVDFGWQRLCSGV